ncbi:TerB family tellurite resistance protein [Brevundimonas sp. TWP2-3-4b1]|uniref:tellurite resistance TerB family protein n=1 Tax=Brevundimonas sp. TWP2-3-4b1 TaxID=2804580 RepID=UPI003CF1DE03
MTESADVRGAGEPSFNEDLECVVSDPLKFKRKLRIGEDAYATLRLKKGVQALWDVGGVAATGATVAASPIIAGSLFASTGGLLSIIGIGAAATPIGWVIAAAAASGGAYYGVSRVVRRQMGNMVDTIPRFINTPIDLLGMQLFDLIGALALRVASIDGVIAPEERASIERHLVDEWGYDQTFTARALDLLAVTTDEARVKVIAKALADFQAASPDCNGVAMQTELLRFLRDVIEADGVIDEREDLAIDAISATFKAHNAIDLTKVTRSIGDLGAQAGTAAAALTRRLNRPTAPRG